MSDVAKLYLGALVLKHGSPMLLEDMLCALFDSLSSRQQLWRDLRWSQIEESERVAFAKSAVMLFGTTGCGCRTCRKNTVIAPMLMISTDSASELLEKAYLGGQGGPRKVL